MKTNDLQGWSLTSRKAWLLVLLLAVLAFIPRSGWPATATFIAMEDATIAEAVPAGNFGGLSTVRTARDDFARETAALLKFDLTSIPAGSIINSAQLELFLRSTDGSPPVVVNVLDVVSGWSEGTVTWGTPRTWNCCFGSASVGFTPGVTVSWNVSNLVATWTATPALSRIKGLALRGSNVFHERVFDSREGVHPPRLAVDFTPPPPDGKIVVMIEEAMALEDSTDTVLGNRQDFYLKVSIDNGPFVVSRRIDGRDHAVWVPAFSVTNDVLKSKRIYPIRIQLWDYDDTSGDQEFDLNPASIAKMLDLEFDACTMRWRRVESSEVFGPGLDWMPREEERGMLLSDPAQISLNITTGDGRPFATNDVLISDASPVQAVFNPKFVIADKATAFMVQLASSWSVSRNAQISVTMSDSVTTVTDSKNVIVPTNGLRVFFFDGTGMSAPFFPTRSAADPRLTYSVQMIVADETTGVPPWFNCVGENNAIFDHSIKIIRTRNPTVLYRRWDWGDSENPPALADFQATINANEPFRQAIFPISVANSTVIDAPFFTGFGEGTPDILSLLPDMFEGEPAQTIALQSSAAMLAGIERVILMPRTDWFDENSDRLTFGSDGIGMSLAEYGPHVAIAEAGTSQTAVHEIGHTFWQSQHTCRTGGAAEDLFNLGCRDEYTHAAEDGRPYMEAGFDVLGAVYPAGIGIGGGTREVLAVNFMDTTGAPNGTYDRWIDRFTFNDLAEKRMRLSQDPVLVSLTGLIWAKQGLAANDPQFVGYLFSSYQFDGLPDLEQAPLGVRSGAGLFSIRLSTGQGDRIYRFNPLFLTKPGKGDFAYFSFAVIWDPATSEIQLMGPSDPRDENKNADVPLSVRKRSSSAPKINTLRAGLNVTPQLGGPQPDPPGIPPDHEAVVAWDINDADAGDELRAALLLRPSTPSNTFSGWLPYAVERKDKMFRIPRKMMPRGLGAYDARLVVSDGVNSTTFDQTNLFIVAPSPVLQLTRKQTSLIVRWPAPPPGYVLEATSSLSANAQWTPVGGQPTPIGGQLELQLPIDQARRFFRLRHQP